MTLLNPCPHCRDECWLIDVTDTPSPVYVRVQAVCACGYRGPLSTTYGAEHGGDEHEQACDEATERHNAIADREVSDEELWETFCQTIGCEMAGDTGAILRGLRAVLRLVRTAGEG